MMLHCGHHCMDFVPAERKKTRVVSAVVPNRSVVGTVLCVPKKLRGGPFLLIFTLSLPQCGIEREERELSSSS